MTLDELRASATPAENGYHRFPAPYRQMSVCLEEADFLYALVRATRPRNVLELGTGLGLSARFMYAAGRENEAQGADAFTLITVEPNVAIREKAAMGLLADVVGFGVALVPALRPDTHWQPDLVYIDSGQKYRADDITTWLTNGYEGLVLVHDAERGYPELNQGVGVYLPTANGMWLGRAK